MDIAPTPQIHDYIESIESSDFVAFKESPSWKEPIFFIPYVIKFLFSDHPRIFQYRQSIFYAKQGSHILLKVIQNVLSNLKNDSLRRLPEPKRTFEITGPAVFTDVLIKYKTDIASIEYVESKKIIQYKSTGSWRKYKDLQ